MSIEAHENAGGVLVQTLEALDSLVKRLMRENRELKRELEQAHLALSRMMKAKGGSENG